MIAATPSHWLIGGQPAWAFLGLAALAIACLYLAIRSWWLAHSIADTARARVRSAPHGYVELYGRAEFAPQTTQTVAPLSTRTCVWWRYHIYQRGSRGGWVPIDSATSDAAFVLHDETAACQIDPRGASVTPSARQVWYGSDCWPSAPFSTGLGLFGSRYRYVEQRIHEYDGVCVLGEFAAVGGGTDSNVEPEVSALLHDWKADQASLLKRFDRDGDGQLNATEWEQARAAARSEVLARQTATPILKQMARPADGRPYILAAKNPRQLAQSYRWQAAASLAGFFATLMVLTRVFLRH